MELHITGDEAADRLLSDDPLALLIGMLLDQQIAMETAFTGPKKIRERTGELSASALAAYAPEAFVEVFRQTPAVHRFPGSMAGRVQALCEAVATDWDDDAAAIWTKGNPDGAEVLSRLKKLPGFGEQMRRASFEVVPTAILSRQTAGHRGGTLIINLPGKPSAVADCLEAVFDAIPYCIDLLGGPRLETSPPAWRPRPKGSGR